MHENGNLYPTEATQKISIVKTQLLLYNPILASFLISGPLLRENRVVHGPDNLVLGPTGSCPWIPAFNDGGLLFAIIWKTSSQGSREFSSFGPDIAQANER